MSMCPSEEEGAVKIHIQSLNSMEVIKIILKTAWATKVLVKGNKVSVERKSKDHSSFHAF